MIFLSANRNRLHLVHFDTTYEKLIVNWNDCTRHIWNYLSTPQNPRTWEHIISLVSAKIVDDIKITAERLAPNRARENCKGNACVFLTTRISTQESKLDTPGHLEDTNCAQNALLSVWELYDVTSLNITQHFWENIKIKILHRALQYGIQSRLNEIKPVTVLFWTVTSFATWLHCSLKFHTLHLLVPFLNLPKVSSRRYRNYFR